MSTRDRFAQQIHNGHNTIPTTDDHHFRHNPHPTNLSATIDRRF
jgi:hypothetical protein